MRLYLSPKELALEYCTLEECARGIMESVYRRLEIRTNRNHLEEHNELLSLAKIRRISSDVFQFDFIPEFWRVFFTFSETDSIRKYVSALSWALEKGIPYSEMN